ncbi:sialate O-acetylesterase isoform X4 [Sphaerodactylus townsendi]|uniref:sialate O-acetylesterase isoform X4 n=1 Tax=Sphaerodactylus townsendi TaxID=933632 RepID=UPI0020275A3B|nr:sialate O-acetylesterase isoform X4 [Sphaerodactylus townsendi]
MVRFLVPRTILIYFLALDLPVLREIMAVCLLFLLTWVLMADARFRFASYFADHMVLQKGPACAVLWGYGEAGANLTVVVYQGNKIVMEKKAQADVFQIWKAVLNPMPQGGPHTIEVHQFYKGKDSNITLQDVYFGDVWLCSGQSNMEMTVAQIFNASKELAEASRFPYVRVFAASLAMSEEELRDLPDIDLQWSLPTAGEANTLMNTDLYNCTFPALIEDWRKAFHEGSVGQTDRYFPFGFVQLSTESHEDVSDSFPRVRWHQTADYGYVPNKKMPNTFMAVALDLCDSSSPYGSIHPRDKQTVAYRLHLGALAMAYGKDNLTFQGPYPQQVQVDVALKVLNVTYNQNIQLDHMDSKVFEVCCSDPALCLWNPIPIRTASFRTVTLHNLTCPETVTGLRYAWTEWPCEYKQCPLYNMESLPAPPFISYSRNNSNWVVA